MEAVKLRFRSRWGVDVGSGGGVGGGVGGNGEKELGGQLGGGGCEAG